MRDEGRTPKKKAVINTRVPQAKEEHEKSNAGLQFQDPPKTWLRDLCCCRCSCYSSSLCVFGFLVLPYLRRLLTIMENKMETTIMENQMENKMENEMETGGIYNNFI